MMNLMKLELKKYPFRNIIVMFTSCTSVILLFTYFFSFVSKVRPEEVIQNQGILSYDFVLNMNYLISIVVFSIFSTFIFSKFILEAYKGDNLFISFTYPIKRNKFFMAKLTICLLLIISLIILGELFVFFVYFFTESFIPIMTETSLKEVNFFHLFKNILLATFQSVVVGLLSLAISFKRKSLPLAIMLSILIAAILCNLHTVGTTRADLFAYILLFILSIGAVFFVMKQIERTSLEGDY